MNKVQAALIANAVAVAVNRLSDFGHVLDEVTDVTDEAQDMNERLSAENQHVIHRLEQVIEQLQAYEPEEGSLHFNGFDIFNIGKAVNEKITLLEQTQSYFVQMGHPHQVVAAVQQRIKDLTFAVAALVADQR